MFNLPMDVLLINALVLGVLSVLKEKWTRKVGLATTLLSFILVTSCLLSWSNQLPLTASLVKITPTLTSYFRVDGLGLFVSLLGIICGLAIVLYSAFNEFKRKIPYFMLLTMCEFGILGVAFSADMFTLFVFWEIMVISSYFLLTFGKDRRKALRVALKYAFISITGSAVLLFSLALIFGQVGSLNYDFVKDYVVNNPNQNVLKVLLALSFVAFFIKSGIFPFHIWVPDVYSETGTPSTVLFSSALNKLGLFVIIRLVFLFFPLQNFWFLTLSILSILTMFTGNLLALYQEDLKRMLAYSSIAHVGYVLLALSVGGFTAGLFHVMNHAIVMTLMFFVVGIGFYLTGSRELKKLRGLGKINPLFGFSIIIGTLTILGMPPFNVFMSELWIVLSTISAGKIYLALILIFNFVLSLFYYIRILQELVLKKPVKIVKKIPLSFNLMVFALALVCIIIGIYPWVWINLLGMVV